MIYILRQSILQDICRITKIYTNYLHEIINNKRKISRNLLFNLNFSFLESFTYFSRAFSELMLLELKSCFKLFILLSSFRRSIPVLFLMYVNVVLRLSECLGQSNRKCISSSILDCVHCVHKRSFLSVCVHLPVSIARLWLLVCS